MFFVLKADITVLESVGYSILGLAIVFAALILLMAIIKIQSALMNKNGKDTANNAAFPLRRLRLQHLPLLLPLRQRCGQIRLPRFRR